MSAPGPDTFLPLNPRVFAILLSLLEGPAHGYGLKMDVEERSGGAVTLDPGSLYRSIARLVEDGVLEEVPTPAAEEGEDARRKYYGLTDLGRAVVQAEASRLDALLDGTARRAGLLEGGRGR
ncbi:MAG: PadR family transcriptional regulator [Gemmatimonadota bacterium]|jgi:DNA-binding PadR family transcriptional regulator